MKTKIIFILLLGLTVTQLNAKPDEAQIKIAISNLNKAISEQSTEAVKANLSEKFTFTTSYQPASENFYLKFLVTSKTLKSVEYLSKVSETEGGALVNLSFQLSSGKKVESVAGFDSDNKILFVDYFDKLYGSSRFDKSELVATIPFTESESGYIMIPLRLNNSTKSLNFMFDTGSDGMAIKKSVAEEIGVKPSNTQNATSAGGAQSISISSGNTVNILGGTKSVELKNQNMAIFTQMEVDGIIGMNFLRDYIVSIDFDSKELKLYNFGDFKFDSKGKVYSITTPYRLILFPASINVTGKEDVEGDFLLDSGASYNFVGFSHFVRKHRMLLTGFKYTKMSSMSSMGKNTTIYNGKVHEFKLGDSSFKDLEVALQAGRNVPNSPDGSIGIGLMKKFNITIDNLRKQVQLSPRQ